MQIKKLKKFISIILSLVFFISLFAVFSNLHFHITNNHLLVPHSHPYDKDHSKNSPVRSHHHDGLEFLVYFNLLNSDGLPLLVFILIILLLLIKYLLCFDRTLVQTNTTYLLPILRAPPFTFERIN